MVGRRWREKSGRRRKYDLRRLVRDRNIQTDDFTSNIAFNVEGWTLVFIFKASERISKTTTTMLLGNDMTSVVLR